MKPFAPIGYHVSYNGIFLKKSKKKKKIKSLHMTQGKQQLKFERNPCNRFRDSRCHSRTTDDGRILISRALLTWSSRAENRKKKGQCAFFFEIKKLLEATIKI